ncbi:hypothetical protein ABZ372_42995, partial [Streptomyces sp. NPDC005921]
MFEIRVICGDDDIAVVTAALNKAFNLGAVRQYPTRDGSKRRLYAIAEHLSPCPDLIEHERARTHPAYVNAPSQPDEMDWLMRQANAGKRDREWWLRRAALADRFQPDRQAEYALPVYAAVITWVFMFQHDNGLVNHVLHDQL